MTQESARALASIATGGRLYAKCPLNAARFGSDQEAPQVSETLPEVCTSFGNEWRALVKDDSPTFPFTSPDRTAQRRSSSIGSECDILGKWAYLKIPEAELDVGLCEQLRDHILFGVDTSGAAKFDELVRDQTVECVDRSANGRNRELLFERTDFVLDHGPPGGVRAAYQLQRLAARDGATQRPKRLERVTEIVRPPSSNAPCRAGPHSRS